MKTSLYLLVTLLAVTYVQAHGFVRYLIVDGKSYTGNIPNGPHASSKASVVRLIHSQDPVKGAKNQAITCGPDAKPADAVADANPGSKLAFDWKVGSGEGTAKWPHNTGPMLTYMASCGNVTCDKFDSQHAKWFKIHETGRDSNGAWHQNNTLFSNKPAEVTIPAHIAPGNYLIRHEIIALHIADKPRGAEFYPSCAQLKIGGSETGKPTATDLVSFPGAYEDDNPGIFDQTGAAFNRNVEYIFPGPKIASFINGGTSGGDKSSDKASGSSQSKQTSSSTAPGPSSTGNKSSGSGSCKLKAQLTVGTCSVPSHYCPSSQPQPSMIISRFLCMF